MKKYIIILLCSIVFLVGCTPKYVGIDKLMDYTIPEDYTIEKNVIYNDNDELISIHYGKNDTSIYFIIMSYNGKAVMGSNEGIEEWLLTTEVTTEEYDLKGADSKMYIYYPIAFSLKESNKKDMIEGMFSYHGYMIMIGMTNNQGDNLTDEEIATYYDILESIKFK